MEPRRVIENDQCYLVAGDAMEDGLGDTIPGRFNRVIADIAEVYPTAILVGAAAAAQYISQENEPRITYDVDVLVGEKDFVDFLEDDIPEEINEKLDAHFENSDSVNHSLKHRKTGIYVDLLSLESKPVRKKIVRFILENRDQATDTFQVGGRAIAILKPEYIIAMKLNRYAKNPRSERALCDRVDIMKLLKALWGDEISPDHEKVRIFCNSREEGCYAAILDDVRSEIKE